MKARIPKLDMRFYDFCIIDTMQTLHDEQAKIEQELGRKMTDEENDMYYNVGGHFAVLGFQSNKYTGFKVVNLWLLTNEDWFFDDVKNGIGYVLAFNSVDPSCSEFGSCYLSAMNQKAREIYKDMAKRFEEEKK